jgi:hypothetical protein
VPNIVTSLRNESHHPPEKLAFGGKKGLLETAENLWESEGIR